MIAEDVFRPPKKQLKHSAKSVGKLHLLEPERHKLSNFPKTSNDPDRMPPSGSFVVCDVVQRFRFASAPQIPLANLFGIGDVSPRRYYIAPWMLQGSDDDRWCRCLALM